jgi:hypothetical protein
LSGGWLLGGRWLGHGLFARSSFSSRLLGRNFILRSFFDRCFDNRLLRKNVCGGLLGGLWISRGFSNWFIGDGRLRCRLLWWCYLLWGFFNRCLNLGRCFRWNRSRFSRCFFRNLLSRWCFHWVFDRGFRSWVLRRVFGGCSFSRCFILHFLRGWLICGLVLWGLLDRFCYCSIGWSINGCIFWFPGGLSRCLLRFRLSISRSFDCRRLGRCSFGRSFFLCFLRDWLRSWICRRFFHGLGLLRLLGGFSGLTLLLFLALFRRSLYWRGFGFRLNYRLRNRLRLRLSSRFGCSLGLGLSFRFGSSFGCSFGHRLSFRFGSRLGGRLSFRFGCSFGCRFGHRLRFRFGCRFGC